MPNWPGTLPDLVLLEGFQETLPNNTLRSGMDTGPPKVRRRTTSAPRPIACNQTLTANQVADLETFYVTTLVSGTLQFTWKNPRTGGAVTTMRFVNPPSWTADPNGGSYYRATYSLEIL